MQDILSKNLPSDDEESDEEYVPTEKELDEDEYKNRFKNQYGSSLNRKRAIREIVQEMKEDWELKLKQKKDKEDIASINIKELLEKVNKDKPQAQVIKFAGKTFNLNDNNECKMLDGPAEENQKPVENQEKPPAEISSQEIEVVPGKVTLSQKFEYLKNLMKVIDAKNINSMTKSRYDWKDYTKKENMEKQFSENRKDGYLEKVKFLEKSKQEEKEYNKGRKKVKTS